MNNTFVFEETLKAKSSYLAKTTVEKVTELIA